MNMMENVSISHEESFYSSQHHLYSDIKLVDISEIINQQLLHSTIGMPDLHPTYTPLEPVYPETSIATSSSSNSTANIQPLYSYSPHNYTDLSLLQSNIYRDPDLSQTARDEGLGSSPSSFSSTTPPLPQPQTFGLTVPSRPSSNFDYSQRSTSSSPESSVSSHYSMSLECSNCGSRSDIFWVNTHYLCRRCLPERPPVISQAPSSFIDQQSSGKRKRTAASARNINQVCSNCGSTNSKLWRRSISSGDTVCNACGLYEKLHHVPRPKHMRKDTIQTRKRKLRTAQPPKSKKSAKKSPIKSEPISAFQEQPPQYIPNAIQSFSLPNYHTLQMRNLQSDINSNHHSTLASPVSSHQSLYVNYRPDYYRHDIYSPVPPNEIMNISQSSSPSNCTYTNS